MVPERLGAAFRFVPWDDTIRFHVRLFRCFLLGILDAHSEPAHLFQGSQQTWAVLGQRLADVGLMRDTGHPHEPVSHRAWCPPKRRYEATSWPSFTTNTAMDLTVPVSPFVPQSINITHGLHDEPRRSAVAFDIPGSGRVLGGYDGLVTGTGVVGYILLWLFTLAIVVSHSSSVARARSDSPRRLPTVAVDATTNSGERALPRDCLLTDEAAQSLVTDAPEIVDHQASMPGAWLLERREQSTLETLEESVLDAIPWTLFHSYAQMGIGAWAHVSGLTCITAGSDPLNRGSEVGRFPVCHGLGLNAFDLDAGVSTTSVLNKTEELGVAVDHLPSEFGPSPESSTTTVHDRHCEPSAMGDVAITDLDPVQMTTLDVVCGNKVASTLALVASSNTDRGSYQQGMSLDGDRSAGEDGSDEELFDIDTRRADISPLERQDAYRVPGRPQDGALSDTGCPFSLRRARSTGCLWKKRDGDEGTGDDFYWTDQVNARLSGERGFRQAQGRSWPQEGREDESDNWRTRSSQVFAAPEETSDAVQCQIDSNSTKLRRYSSPPLNLNADRAGSGDGPPGIYVVPQRRGGRCWSPVSSPRPTGLGFLPFRKAPPLLTPEAWRPGCLYLSDPPVEESREADAWWDSLTAGTVTQEQEPSFSRKGSVSWRDRYENDSASRRFISVHRRATTEG